MLDNVGTLKATSKFARHRRQAHGHDTSGSVLRTDGITGFISSPDAPALLDDATP